MDTVYRLAFEETEYLDSDPLPENKEHVTNLVLLLAQIQIRYPTEVIKTTVHKII